MVTQKNRDGMRSSIGRKGQEQARTCVRGLYIEGQVFMLNG